MLARMAAFLRNDFIEYNAHNYQDYTTTALLNLASYADNTKVKTAAQSVLDYISAKVAVSSNDARRSTPFRRKKGKDDPDPSYNCPELIGQHCSDPQTAFYMMLAGVTEILPQVPEDPRDPQGNKVSLAPGSYAYEFQWAALSQYRIPDLILDLFVNPDHRNFYQFFHYCNTDCNDELYFGSPSYLIAAGGHPTDYAYRADIPFPISLITGSHPGSKDDLGAAVPTVLMPTGEGTSRVDMI